MIKIAIFILAIGQVFADSCVYDAANFLEIYQIFKTKQMIGQSQYLNNEPKTSMRILQNPNQNSATVTQSPYDKFKISYIFVPLQVIDMTSLITSNPSSKFTLDLIKEWEKNYGKIPSDSIVFARTNLNTQVFNGWESEALDFLFNSRNVTGIGHDQQQDAISDDQKQYFYNKIYITNTASLVQNSQYTNLVQIRKLSQISEQEWFIDIQTLLPQNVCSTPKRLVNQWWSVIIILAILLLLIYLIYYCCLKRFDKYNKEEFKPLDWEQRNQDGIYFNQEELNVPLQEMHQTQQQQSQKHQ